MSRVVGKVVRPTCAIVGPISDENLARLKETFPIVYYAPTFGLLKSRVHEDDIDVVVVTDMEDLSGAWPAKAHFALLSEHFTKFPGSGGLISVSTGNKVVSTRLLIPDQMFGFESLIENFVAKQKVARGMRPIRLTIDPTYYSTLLLNRLSGSAKSEAPSKEALDEQIDRITAASGILFDPHTGAPFFSLFEFDGSYLLCIPGQVADAPSWISQFVSFLAENVNGFPVPANNWRKSKKWISKAEMDALSNLESVTANRRSVLQEEDAKVAEASAKLEKVSREVGDAEREILECQGDELVNAVARYFKYAGFKVLDVDDYLNDGDSKREDLRVTDGDWTAIVEVRGYKNRSAKLHDLQRLSRFEKMFSVSEKRFPDKKIYVINGQFGRVPDQRDRAFEAAEEDLVEFANDNGLVIETTELFLAKKLLSKHELYIKLRNSVGLFDHRAE